MEQIGDGLRKRNFWEFNIGNAATICIALGAILIWWANFSTLPRETADRLESVAKLVDRMNEKNTFAGQLDTQRQIGINTSFDARILALEKNTSVMNEKLTDVQAKLNVIAALLEAQKKK